MIKNLNSIPKIRVIIRKRPLNKKQYNRGEKDIIHIPNNQTVLVQEEKVKVDLTPYLDQYKFIFDGAFNENSTNEQIYISTVRPLIDASFDGARVSCFAYGQTGSGKTYTMFGNGKNVKGLYLLASQDVFEINKRFQDLTIWISFYQIYCGKLYDLLNERSILHARQDAKNNINIVGLSQRKAENITEIMNAIQFGTSIRATAQNSTNVDSSRSHAILQIVLKQNKRIHGKISFIDLAGSQRAADHADQTDKQTRIDGAEINKSLLALKQCIRALDQNKNHTPFRGSKLTMVLKDSFVGYCKTVMIANVSPNSISCENTLNTLKYADRVKELKKSQTQQKLPNDYLNDLSRELMLPRQLVRHQINFIDDKKNVQSPNTVKQNNFIDNQSKAIKQKEENFQVRNTPIITTRQQHFHRQIRPHSSATPTTPNKLSSQSEQEIYQRLNQRHEEMLQKVIEGQETLISQHEIYINFAVDCAKEHIQIMHKADQVGSSIDNYLNRLDSTLQKQMQQIYKIKSLIENLKYNLDESKKIEDLYMIVNKNPKQQMNNNRNINLLRQDLGQLNFNYNQQYAVCSKQQSKSKHIYFDENQEEFLFD